MPTNREIEVTEHALLQYQQRKRDFRPYSVLEEHIKSEVEESFRAGRVKDHRPKGFLLYGRSNNQLPQGQRLALNEDESIGWIIKRERSSDVVLTTLTRTGVNR